MERIYESINRVRSLWPPTLPAYLCRMDRYYDILGIRPGATDAEIRRAYRRLARRYHPDVNPSADAAEKFVELAEAYEYLIEKRYLNLWNELASTDTVEPDPRAKREAERRERARQYAERKRAEFRNEIIAFQKTWYFIPAKFLAFGFVWTMYIIGVMLVASPIIAWFATSDLVLTILLILLGIVGGHVFQLGTQVRKKVKPYFQKSD